MRKIGTLLDIDGYYYATSLAYSESEIFLTNYPVVTEIFCKDDDDL